MGEVLDLVFKEGLITASQNSDLRRMLRQKETKETVARKFFDILRNLPPPSFDRFIGVLDRVKGGKKLRDCLTREQPAREGAAAPIRPAPSRVPSHGGDSKWRENLIPSMPKVVTCLSNILPEVLDLLVARELITTDQYDDLRRSLRQLSKTDAARDLFSLLTKRPPPSFDRFIGILDEVDGGKDLRDCLIRHETAFPDGNSPVEDHTHLQMAVAEVGNAEWIGISLRLGVKHYRISDISHAYKSKSEKLLFMIEEWRRHDGRTATVERLLKACKSVKVSLDEVQEEYSRRLLLQ